MRHSVANRVVPPFLVALVIGCVWYAMDSRPKVGLSAPVNATSQKPLIASVNNATATPTVSPVVQKHGSVVQFSVDTATYQQINKVEFYVEDLFVGTAYSKPYAVAVSENSLSAGTHTVKAKIYTAKTTSDSRPATFDSSPSIAATPVPATSNPKDITAPPAPTTTLPADVAAPTNVAGTASIDGTSATLTWSSVTTATSYAVWRDNLQVSSVNGTSYTDTGLTKGHTYDYFVVALGSTGTSIPSSAVAVTMPSVLGDSTTNPSNQSPPPPAQSPQPPSSP